MINESCVIIPTYNERDSISPLIKELAQNYNTIDIFVVDDNSPDGTGDIAENLSKVYGNLRVVHNAKKFGLASAYKNCFRMVLNKGYKYIFQMDGDSSHHPKYMPGMLSEIKAGADMAIGSRYKGGLRVSGWQIFRLILSYAANCYARIMLGTGVYDSTSGFRCFNADSLKTIDLSGIRSEGFAFQIEIAYSFHKKGYRIEEVPIIFFGRKKDKSKLSGAMIVEAFFTVLKLAIPTTISSLREEKN